jgi:hypothetical protein
VCMYIKAAGRLPFPVFVNILLPGNGYIRHDVAILVLITCNNKSSGCLFG